MIKKGYIVFWTLLIFYIIFINQFSSSSNTTYALPWGNSFHLVNDTMKDTRSNLIEQYQRLIIDMIGCHYFEM